MNAHVKPDQVAKPQVDDLECDICDLARLALATDIIARNVFDTLRKASNSGQPAMLPVIYSMQERERELLMTRIDDLKEATDRLRSRLYEVIECPLSTAT